MRNAKCYQMGKDHSVLFPLSSSFVKSRFPPSVVPQINKMTFCHFEESEEYPGRGLR